MTSTLFIPDVIVADEGGYYCTAWIDRVSASSQTAYLQEIGIYTVIGIYTGYMHCNKCINEHVYIKYVCTFIIYLRNFYHLVVIVYNCMAF